MELLLNMPRNLYVIISYSIITMPLFFYYAMTVISTKINLMQSASVLQLYKCATKIKYFITNEWIDES